MAGDHQGSRIFDEGELRERVDRLPSEQRAIFERCLNQVESDQRTAPEILRASREDLPLSFAQQRLWFLHQVHPDLPIYNNTRALRIEGPLNVAVLEQVLNEIVRRHESLRTTFVMGDGGPVQVITAHLEAPLAFVDLAGAYDAEDQARRLAAQAACLPFDLSRGPLIRATLLRLDASTHLLHLTIHHIVSDRWSMTVFFKEVSQLYEAFSKGAASPLPELASQYADFAVWQRERLTGELLERHLAYWASQLAPPHPVLELAPNRPRGDAHKFFGAVHHFLLDKELAAKLRAFSRRQGVTLFMTLLAAFQTLLYRYTEEEDIIVGSPIAGRPRVETEALIGLFVNTLPMRTSLAGDPTVAQLLNRVRQTALGAYEHQELPFERLVEFLQPERSVDHNPLFQVMFALQNMPRHDLSLPGLTLTSEHVFTNTAKFDLLVMFVEGPEGLAGRIEYRTDILGSETVEQIAKHLVTLLAAFPDHADQRISTLPLLDSVERQRIVEDWNATRSEYPRDRRVHELFEEQVARRPDAVAVIDRGNAVTYGDLNRRANRLARRLQAAGAGPDDVVGILLDRSVELIVGLLAIVKAGAAYLPLDPRSPRDRLNAIVEDARVRILLSDSRHSGQLPAAEGRLTLLLDHGEAEQAGEPDENPVSHATAEHTAYVMYTSGSTGTPKGVLVRHRAINRLVLNTNYISLQPSDVVAQVSICSFDAAVFEIWGALLHGARLALIPENTILSPKDFAAELARLRVTTAFVTTALFNLVARERPDAFHTVTHLLFGGEAADPRAVAAVLKAGGPRRLIHVYGPTEATTFASWYEVNDVATGQRTIPIGRPLANTEVYVLDTHLQPVPVGAPGEIYIGGDGVARGYLNDERLTAERFVPDSLSARPGARLYKTGDVGRFRPDGNLEFVSRRDHQVKIRGFRVEPAEIEAVLQAHPSVSQVLIVGREDVPGDRRLVAYIVARDSHASLIPELQQLARTQLPDYLVPSFWMLLEALPLTSVGKVDRQALPAPNTSASHAVGSYQAPRDGLELRLTKVWEDLLRRRPIGVTENFFNLGGHSLLAAQLCATIEKTFATRLPLATFLQWATIEHQAEMIRGRDVAQLWSSLVPIRAGGTKPPFFCVHGVGGNVVGFKDLARHLPADQPVYGLQSRGLDGKGVIDFRVEDMAAHYVTHVLSVQPSGPYALGGLSFGGLVAFEMARQLHQQGHEVALLALFDTLAPRRRRAVTLGARLRIKASGYLARAAYHARNLIFGPDRATHLRRRSRTIRRRITNRLWHTAFNAYRRFDYPLPRPLLSGTQANFHARLEYVPEFYPGRVTLFKASERSVGSNTDPQSGWERLAALGVEVHQVPGNHVTMIAEPHVQTLARTLARCLDEARQRQG